MVHGALFTLGGTALSVFGWLAFNGVLLVLLYGVMAALTVRGLVT